MLEKIIESCRYVEKNSNSVKINETKIDEFVKTIKGVKIQNWLITSIYGLLDLPIEKIINFLLIFESIDFSFWGEPKWSIETSEGTLDGSNALLYRLLEYTRSIDSTDFSEVTLHEFKKILEGNTEIPLLKERYNIVKNISKVVNQKMNGNFYEFIKDVTIDTQLFEIIVDNFEDFKDERIYKGNTIYFYKLAQLLVSDILHIREKIQNIQVDYSHLVGCADYKIPQVMRALGILEYNNTIADIIDNKKIIEINSEYEVEIRANMIVVIDMIKNKLDKRTISAIDINDYIWLQSKNKKLQFKPYHLTRNVDY